MLILYCSDSFLSLLCQIPGIPLLTTQTSGSGEFLKIYNLSQISIIDQKSSARFASEKITQSKNYFKFLRYFMNHYKSTMLQKDFEARHENLQQSLLPEKLYCCQIVKQFQLKLTFIITLIIMKVLAAVLALAAAQNPTQNPREETETTTLLGMQLIFLFFLPLRSKKAGRLRNSLALLGDTCLSESVVRHHTTSFLLF